jgi:hypothetical protein
MTGHMLHGVKKIVVHSGPSGFADIHPGGEGRVYLWDNGAITVYRDDEPWEIIPAHRVYSIRGGEAG